MTHLRKHVLAVVCLVGILAAASIAAADEFPLKEGDVWVMVGDSITAQHLHSNYFEAFCYARLPRLAFAFRNSGVGGDTVPRVLARFDWDVAVWKPTVVSVELGMNDAGRYKTAEFMANMDKLVQQIRGIGARAVLFSPSPVNNGGMPTRWVEWNRTLADYSKALAAYAAKEKIPYANQFQVLHAMWERNTADLYAVSVIEACSKRPDWPGRQHLLAWDKAWRSYTGVKPVSLGGNPVHPGPTGQVMMAAALLEQLGAPGLVSSAALKASGEVLQSGQCKITNVKAGQARIDFTRLDDALPMPIPEAARPALRVMPAIEGLSRYTLQLLRLPEGSYDLTMDGQKVASPTAKCLADGLPLGDLDRGPIAAQCARILDLVDAKEKLVGQYRGTRKEAAAKKAAPDERVLADLNEQIQQADAQIRAAAQPKPHRFVLTPARQ